MQILKFKNFFGTKESVYIRKEINSHRIGLGHQHGRRFIVWEHQYGRRDVMWKRYEASDWLSSTPLPLRPMFEGITSEPRSAYLVDS